MLYICLILSMLLLSSCKVYNPLSNSDNVTTVDEKQNINSDSAQPVQDNTSSDENSTGEKWPSGFSPYPIITQDKIIDFNNTIKASMFDDEENEIIKTVEYTPIEVKEFANVTDAGITLEDIEDKSIIDDEGNLNKDNTLFVFSIKVKNIDAKFNKSQDGMGLYIEPMFKLVEKNKENQADYTIAGYYNSFFINGDFDKGSKSYCRYHVDQGNTREIQIGYIVDTSKYNKSDLYFQINTHDADYNEIYNYIKIN